MPTIRNVCLALSKPMETEQQSFGFPKELFLIM